MTRTIPRVVLLLLFLTPTLRGATYPAGSPHTTNNDDSCDIALLPAATLLVPWFEVDLTKPQGGGETTLITMTNVSPSDQIARVTLWTDRAFPVISFNVYLTGYDVQSLNLYDIIALGQIAPPRGTGYDDAGSPLGDFSRRNEVLDVSMCRNLPAALPVQYVERMKRAFTTGAVPSIGSLPACNGIGGTHARASGYATIDVVRRCGFLLPNDSAYFNDEILFDNVLMGEYQQIDASNNAAQGAPAVHIRAIPEGGTAAERAADPAAYAVNFPRTFYGRFQGANSPKFDARQPLPTQFAGHWISGGPGAFETDFKIWREAKTGLNAACDAYAANGDLGVGEVVRFDENENFTVLPEPICCILPYDTQLPAAARVDVEDSGIFPTADNDDRGGWVFLNLDDPQSAGASQAWVVSSMRAEGRFSVDADVIALGNGCTPPLPSQSEANADGFIIGPAADVNP